MFFTDKKSTFLSIGLMFAYGATLSPQTKASEASCRLEISRFKHCEIHPAGVHDLDCFGNYKSRGMKTCVWKPGNHTSKKTYTVAVRQHGRKNCQLHKTVEESLKDVSLYEKYNVTVEVFDHSEAANCTKAVFHGSPKNLLRCGPPGTANFSRLAGSLHVNVSWSEYDVNAIKNYNVRYKTLGSPAWSESPVASENRSSYRVDALNSSLVYFIQIQCVTNERCSQCPWSGTYTVPIELTTRPVIVQRRDEVIALEKGRRLISVTWKFPDTELHDGYYVTVWKASGETPGERTTTPRPHVRLVLSHSSYLLNISAVNNASVSPAASLSIPQREGTPGVHDGRLNVTVHHNKSFTVFWKDDLVKSYVCYSVEWREKEQKTTHKSFYERINNYRKLLPIPEPLKPYTRYSLTLHTRPQNDTCNMVNINNSESTYGSTRFYSVEGSPIGAPANISISNVTLDSAVLRWSCIPEEDIRGFLVGYIIHYTEYHHRGTSTENNVTVDPALNSFELADLRSGAAYHIQMSGFTSAGAGVRSSASFFKTKHKGRFDPGLVGGFVVVGLVLICGSTVIKRMKLILWPSIPNPGKSNAMQGIGSADELELMEAIKILKVEEWDLKSLHILEREAASPANVQLSVLAPLNPSEDDEDSPARTSSWVEEETDNASISWSDPNGSLDTQQTDVHASAFAFTGGYTTMEMFQQGTSAAVDPAVEGSSPDPDLNEVKPGPDYVRQFSNGPASEGEDVSTMA